jgi:signal transduction histidine kinase
MSESNQKSHESALSKVVLRVYRGFRRTRECMLAPLTGQLRLDSIIETTTASTLITGICFVSILTFLALSGINKSDAHRLYLVIITYALCGAIIFITAFRKKKSDRRSAVLSLVTLLLIIAAVFYGPFLPLAVGIFTLLLTLVSPIHNPSITILYAINYSLVSIAVTTLHTYKVIPLQPWSNMDGGVIDSILLSVVFIATAIGITRLKKRTLLKDAQLERITLKLASAEQLLAKEGNYTLPERFLELVEIGEETTNILHDIRTPINSLLLGQDEFNQNHRESINYLASLVSKSDGQDGPNPAAYQLTFLVNQTCKAVHYTLASDRIRIHSELDPDIYVMTDYTFFVRILSNLLSNAAYAARNRPEHLRVIELYTVTEDTTVKIYVKDHGHGIPIHVQNRLFTTLVSTKPPSIGMGRGLYSSQVYAKQISSKIDLISSDTSGTVFSLTLPACNPNQIELTHKQNARNFVHTQ